MLKSYMILKDTIIKNSHKLDTSKEVTENDKKRKVEMMPDKRENKKFKKLFHSLEPFERLTKRLQNDNITMRKVRGYFDDVIVKHPELVSKLGTRAEFINNPHFEDGIVKIQNGMEKNLSESERKAVSVLEVSNNDIIVIDDDEDMNENDFVDKVPNDKIQGNQYVNCDWIPPTSNLCERLFSRSKLVFSERRKSLMPINLEIVLFLKLNRHLWTVHTVHEVYKDINLTKSSFEHECSSDCACSVAVMEKGYVSSGSDEDSVDEE